MIKNDIFLKFEKFIDASKLAILRKYDKFNQFSDSLESSRYDEYVFITCRLSKRSACINVKTKQPMFFDDKQEMFDCVTQLMELQEGINILEIK